MTLIVLFAIACVFAFGITPDDLSRIEAFDRAVQRWQRNPDFRAVTFEYVDLGSAAMQVRICGIPAKSAIMAFRKIPGLPESLAVNPTSQSHYDDFSRGPWAAYFHLSAEQDVGMGIGLLQKLGNDPSDEQIRQMLGEFHLPVPIATDAGAVVSVRRLLDDLKSDHPFVVRASALSAENRSNGDGYPMQRQMGLLQTLDRELRAHDQEAWRTKQVNDFLSGIWAQGYGQIYASGIGAVRIARRAGQITIATILIVCIARLALASSRGSEHTPQHTPRGRGG